MDDKNELRQRLRALRRDHVAALPPTIKALLFLRPPSPIAAMIPDGSTVALYHATAYEAPTRSYAKWFSENGRKIALPWFADRDSPMRFREWGDPYEDSDLVQSPWGGFQPRDDSPELAPDTAFIPLLGFTGTGGRIGQGGGHYDRWLAANPAVQAIGMAWDCQLLDTIPVEPHDIAMRAVVTPTRLYNGD